MARSPASRFILLLNRLILAGGRVSADWLELLVALAEKASKSD